MVRILSLLALSLLLGCQSQRWSPADAKHPNRMRSCTGQVLKIDTLEDGGLRLQMKPRNEDKTLLAEGQTAVIYDLPAEFLSRFKGLVADIEPGSRYEISGWFVRDTDTGMHHLRPVTSIDPYPDSK